MNRLRNLLLLAVLALCRNFVVAWALAVVRPFELDGWSQSLDDHTDINWYYFPDEDGATAWNWSWGSGSPVEGRGLGWETRSLGFFGHRGDDEVRRIADDPPPALISSIALPTQATDLSLVYCKSGLPLAAFEGAVVLNYSGDPDRPYPEITNHSSVLAPIRPTRGSWPSHLSQAEIDIFSGHRVVLPIRPIASGLLVNTALFMVLIALVVTMPGMALRHWRRRTGRCPSCGYSRAPDRPCAECGLGAAWHSTPVTVYREDGGLVAEAILYERETKRSLAIVRADLTERGMQNVQLSPPPGTEVAGTVPAWQMEIFQRPDLAKNLRDKARSHLR